MGEKSATRTRRIWARPWLRNAFANSKVDIPPKLLHDDESQGGSHNYPNATRYISYHSPSSPFAACLFHPCSTSTSHIHPPPHHPAPPCRPTLTAVKPPHLYHHRFPRLLPGWTDRIRNPCKFRNRHLLSKRSQTLPDLHAACQFDTSSGEKNNVTASNLVSLLSPLLT